MTKEIAPMSGAQVKEIRTRYDLTQAGLGNVLRIKDDRTIRRWESGERDVSGPASILLELMAAGELPERYLPPGSAA